MPDSTQSLAFEASAYLQRLIGRELFRSQDLAVVELVKNSYDAGSKHVRIVISMRTERRPASFEILDDGTGMNAEGLQRLFMVAGYSEKNLSDDGRGRIPTGEKGIGRFAADRLGRYLKIETKVAGAKEGTVVEIDWAAFEARKKKFSEISVPYFVQPLPFLADHESGTRITITAPREPWNPASIKALRQTLSELLNPFEVPAEFRMNLQAAGSEALSGEIVSTPIVRPDFDLRFEVTGGGEVKRTFKKYPQQDVALRPEYTSLVVPEAKKLVGLRGRLYYYLKRPKRDQVNGRVHGVFFFGTGFEWSLLGRARPTGLALPRSARKELDMPISFRRDCLALFPYPGRSIPDFVTRQVARHSSIQRKRGRWSMFLSIISLSS